MRNQLMILTSLHMMKGYPLDKIKEEKIDMEFKAIGLVREGNVKTQEELEKITANIMFMAESYGYKCEAIGVDDSDINSINRQELMSFLYPYIGVCSGIFVDEIATISEDEVEVKIFVAALSFIGVSVYAVKEEKFLDPDVIYEEEIGNVFSCRCKHNELYHSDNKEIKAATMKFEFFQVMGRIWENCRGEVI